MSESDIFRANLFTGPHREQAVIELARLAVCDRSESPEDARDLLGMLGLLNG